MVKERDSLMVPCCNRLHTSMLRVEYNSNRFTREHGSVSSGSIVGNPVSSGSIAYSKPFHSGALAPFHPGAYFDLPVSSGSMVDSCPFRPGAWSFLGRFTREHTFVSFGSIARGVSSGSIVCDRLRASVTNGWTNLVRRIIVLPQ